MVSFPHGEHPDGDPFAEQDRLRNQNTAIGRLEARALAEQAQQELAAARASGAGGGAGAGGRSTRSTPTTGGGAAGGRTSSTRSQKGKATPVTPSTMEAIVLDSDSDESDAIVAAQMATAPPSTRRRTTSNPVTTNTAPSSAPTSKGKGKGKASTTGAASNGSTTTTSGNKRGRPSDDGGSNLLDASMMETLEDSDSRQPQAQRQRTRSPSPPAAAAAAVEPAPAFSSSFIDLAAENSTATLSNLSESRPPSPVPEIVKEDEVEDEARNATDAMEMDPPAAPVVVPSPSKASLSALLSPSVPITPSPTTTTTHLEPIEVPLNIPPAVAAAAAPVIRRHRSLTPPPRPKPPPKTIRLSLDLPRPGSTPSYPEHNIAHMAKAAGFVSEEAEEEAKDSESEGEEGDGDEDASSESDGEGGRRKKVKGKGKEKEKDREPESERDGAERMEGVEGQEGEKKDGENTPGAEQPKKKRRKRGPNVVVGRFGGYDNEDPFVDDSEIQLYEPKYCAKPLREGYFVAFGDVEVETQKKKRGRAPGSKNKPKYDENGTLIPATRKKPGDFGSDSAAPSSSNAIPGPSNILPVYSLPHVNSPSMPTFGNPAVNVQAMPLPPQEPPKPVKKKGTFSPELTKEIDMLKLEVAKESFEVKNKFPPRLRPIITSVALFAQKTGELDDDFFSLLPKIFPYNLFTMKKLVKREIFPHRMEALGKIVDEHLEKLKKMVEADLGRQKGEFERSKKEWETEQREKKVGTPELGEGGGGGAMASGSALGGGGGGFAALPGTPDLPNGFTPVDGQSPGAATLANAAAAAGGDPKDKEPVWKFRFNEAMKLELLHAVEVDEEMSALISEKQELEKATTRDVNREKAHSGLNARKVLYGRMIAMWPEGDMTTNQLSREMSAIKNKIKTKVAKDRGEV